MSISARSNVIYQDKLMGQAPPFPREIEEGIDEYLAIQASTDGLIAPPVTVSDAVISDTTRLCRIPKARHLHSFSSGSDSTTGMSNLDQENEPY